MSTTTEIPATPAKLRSGDWGARVRQPVEVGDTVTITTKAGKSWTARVTSIVWRGKGVYLCSTESLDRAPVGSSGARTGCRCGSREDDPRDSDCWQCRHDY